MSTRIAFSTCRSVPLLSLDDQLAIGPLLEHGIEVVPWIWDDPAPPPDVDAVVHRSCWDYHHRPEAFRAWLDVLAASGLPSFNSPSITAWNLDKRYLRDLAARGVTIPETIWLPRGERVDLAALLRDHDLDEVVLKPQISLSAFATFRASRADVATAQTQLDTLLAERAMMVQPFLPEITAGGELSFLFFGGELSHAVRKVPRSGDFRVQQDHGGSRSLVAATPAQIAAAARVLAAAQSPLLFARIDVVETARGLVLMELEAIDPELFLAFDPAAPGRFAAAVARAIASRRAFVAQAP
jgi:glutathione synthase/RimK-type ligase-like ATP-grasp enzyme